MAIIQVPAAQTGGMTLLQTLSISGSSVTSSTLSTSYKQFLIYITELYGTGGVSLQLRLNGDTGSNYSWETIDFAGSAATDRADASAIFRLGNQSNDSGLKRRTSGIITLMRPSDTNVVYVTANMTGYNAGLIGTVATGVYDSSAAITTITLFPSSGTLTAGTAYIYGVN
jgi:hypothetical protein